MRRFLVDTSIAIAAALVLGLLIAWTIATAEAPAITAPPDELPVRGEHFVVVTKTDTMALLVDPSSIKDEADGSVSIKYLQLMGTPTQTAGRFGFKCASRQWHVQSFYEIDHTGKPLTISRSSAWEEIPPESMIEQLSQHVCNTQHPAEVTNYEEQ